MAALPGEHGGDGDHGHQRDQPSTKPRRSPAKRSGSSAPAMPSPGHIAAASASADQPVASPLAAQAPAVPPGTRNGRGGSGRMRRSRTSAGNTRRLTSASSEIESASTTPKYLALSWPATANAAPAVAVAIAPPTTVARSGVPVLADTRLTWTRLQDFATLIAGLYAALSPIWVATTDERGAFWALIALGVLLAVAALVSLAMPGVVATEALTVLFGVLLFIAPWVLTYTDRTGASWTSWVVGAIAIILGGSAVPMSNRAHQQAIQH